MTTLGFSFNTLEAHNDVMKRVYESILVETQF